ncbi:NF-kappa-B inhibitor cactus-like isoform X2 [Plodia interpunctella]|uniref:NF-kappa-B inhibitor cactus-like isoform X2 n=1 Tax=Plodia interpunctella TaxID=58824 RepID=UPI00236746A0|nr:NF-kappa-B inhibitor cactus-like isoform X2 [Plodia interpunctella]
MSAKKGYDTKLPEDENTDSGFLSGEQLFSGELESGSNLDSDSKNLHSDTVDVNTDSGVVCISENLSLLDLDTPTEQPRREEPKNADIAILNVLFQQDEDGDSQLHIAAVHGCQKSVSTLINLCPDKSWLDMPNEYGHTPLHLAAMSGHEVITRMLVVAGASIAARDRRGQTPIHVATEMSQVECLKALLAPVKEHPTRKMSSILNQKNYNGQTCVHTAANTGHIKTLQTLVYYGADINMREGLAGSTALHIAARRGDVPLAQYLLAQCPGVERGARDWAGRSPRRLARRAGAARAFAALSSDSDSDSDDDDDVSTT